MIYFMNRVIKMNFLSSVFVLFFLASCATKNNALTGTNPPPVIIPPVTGLNIQTTVDEVLGLNGNIGFRAVKNYVTVGNGNNINNINPGRSFHRGVERIIATRVYFLREARAPARAAFIGNRVIAMASNITHDCTGTACVAQTNAPNMTNAYGTAIFGLYYQELGDLLNPARPNNQSFGFGFNLEQTTYTPAATVNYAAVTATGVGSPYLRSDAYERAVNQANNDGRSMIVYNGADGLRLSGTTFVNGNFIDNSSILTNANTADTNPYIAVRKIASSFKGFLDRDGKNAIVMSSGTMTKYDISKYNATSINTSLASNVSYGYYASSSANEGLGVFNSSFVQGDIIRWLEGKGQHSSYNRIALAMPVMATTNPTGTADYSYKPHAESVLFGSLKDYGFSVPMTTQFGAGVGAGPGTVEGGSTGVVVGMNGYTNTTRGQAAAAILAGQINTLAMAYGNDSSKAIGAIKSNYTFKQYGAPITEDSFITSSGNFYRISDKAKLKSLIESSAVRGDIILFFDKYAAANGGKINDSKLNGAGVVYDINNKWNSILSLYGHGTENDRTHMLSQFVTNSDILVRDGNGNIIAMNGMFAEGTNYIQEKQLQYQYIDAQGNPQNGTSIVYTYVRDGKEYTIASNVFGNGIVDYTTLYNTQTITGIKLFDTRAKTSSVMGDGLKSAPITNFLSTVNMQMGGVYENLAQNAVLSFNGQIESSSASDIRTDVALKNLLVETTNQTRGNFNLGFAKVSFDASSIEGSAFKGLNTENAITKQVMAGFAGANKRFGEGMLSSDSFYQTKAIIAGSKAETSGELTNLGFAVPAGEKFTISTLAFGNDLSSLSLESERKSFSLLSNNLGFRDGYASFSELFESSNNITGSAVSFAVSTNKTINFIVAQGSKANIFNEEQNKSSLAKLEFAQNFGKSYLKISSGMISETGGYLGFYGTGGFAIANSNTAFVEAEGELNVSGNYFVNASASFGLTNVKEGEKTMISNYSTIKSSAFSIGASHKGFFGGTLGANFSQSLRISSANADFNNGFAVQNFNITPEGMEKNFEISYSILKGDLNVKTSLVHTQDLNNIKGEKQNLAVIKLNKKF